jgi:hypothetical protein
MSGRRGAKGMSVMGVMQVTETREVTHCSKCAANAKTNESCKSGRRVPELAAAFRNAKTIQENR